MRIIRVDTEKQLLVYASNNYKHNEIIVVCYGLDIQQFESAVKAARHVRECIAHFDECTFN